MSSYYKLINILYFSLGSRFSTSRKGLDRFLTIAWVVGRNYSEKIETKSQASSLPNSWITWEKLKHLIYRVEFLKKEGFKIFMLVKVKRPHLRPTEIYCRDKIQLVQKLFFYYYYQNFNSAKALICRQKRRKLPYLEETMCTYCVTLVNITIRFLKPEKDLLFDI